MYCGWCWPCAPPSPLRCLVWTYQSMVCPWFSLIGLPVYIYIYSICIYPSHVANGFFPKLGSTSSIVVTSCVESSYCWKIKSTLSYSRVFNPTTAFLVLPRPLGHLDDGHVYILPLKKGGWRWHLVSQWYQWYFAKQSRWSRVVNGIKRKLQWRTELPWTPCYSDQTSSTVSNQVATFKLDAFEWIVLHYRT